MGRPRLFVTDLKPCAICGEPITPHPDDCPSKYNKRQVCGNPACRSGIAARGRFGKVPHNKLPPILPRACQVCGVQFTPPNRKNLARYCSDTCRLDGLHHGMRGENNPNYKPKISVRCETCGKSFEVSEWRITWYKTHHCSRACMGKAKAKITGEDHPLFKPKTPMACEVCGTIRMVKPSLVSRFRACSRRCAATIGQVKHPRISSIEVAVKAALDNIGEGYEQQAVFKWYTVDFYLPRRSLVIECDGTYWHSSPKQQRIDKSKDSYLRNRGIHVARLTEEAIRADVESAVREALHS